MTDIILSSDKTRLVDVVSGFSWDNLGPAYWDYSDVEDIHADVGTGSLALNATKLIVTSEAHRCGCLPPLEHAWFAGLAAKGHSPCYSVTKGVWGTVRISSLPSPVLWPRERSTARSPSLAAQTRTSCG